MAPAEIAARLKERFGDAVGELTGRLDPWVVVSRERIVEICKFLKNTEPFDFDALMNESGCDFLPEGKIKITYHLWSYRRRHGFILKVELNRQEPVVDTVESVWKAANWWEREIFDLLGVTFTGHSDLRRILLPDDWVGHPHRKDYQEAASWHGISTTRESPLQGFIRLDQLRKSQESQVKN